MGQMGWRQNSEIFEISEFLQCFTFLPLPMIVLTMVHEVSGFRFQGKAC
jgi:hypothetical protein